MTSNLCSHGVDPLQPSELTETMSRENLLTSYTFGSFADQEDGSDGDPTEDKPRVGEFLKNKSFTVKLGDHHSSEGKKNCKSGVPQVSMLGPLLFQIFIYDLENQLTCNHVFCANDVKLITRRIRQHELRPSIKHTPSCIHKLKFGVYHEARQSSQFFSPDRCRCFW